MRTVIINGGSIEDGFALGILKKQPFDYMIAADSGLEFLKRANLTPDEILGDFDSVDPEVGAWYKKSGIRLTEFPPEKDSTDMELAMMAALERGSSEILILGATGTRLDHVLGSIQNLSMAADRGIPCTVIDPHNRIRMVRDSLTIRKSEQFGKYVSVIPHGGDVEGLTLTGFYYPLDHAFLKADSALGVSNQITEEEARISLKKGTVLVIESRD